MFFYERIHSKSNHLYCHFNSNVNFPMHMHRSFEFIHVQSGNMSIQIGNRIHTLRQSDAVLILPDQPHAYFLSKEPLQNFICIFSADHIYDFYSAVKGKRADDPIFRLDSPACVEQLADPANPFIVKSALYSIAGQFMNGCKLTDTADGNLELLERIISYIQTHFNEQITLTELAKTLGYHYNYISSYINENIGVNFRAFVNMFRIDYACTLLTETEYSVTEIAQRCGFGNIRSFNRCFRLIQNCTPSEYAKSAENRR